MCLMKSILYIIFKVTFWILKWSFLALARAIKNSTSEAIAFEKEMVKISQVTGNTVKSLSSLSKEVTRLATGLGAGFAGSSVPLGISAKTG